MIEDAGGLSEGKQGSDKLRTSGENCEDQRLRFEDKMMSDAVS